MYKPKAAANSLQSSPTLCDPIDDSPPGSPIPGILQARTLEWVAISFSNAWKWKVKVKSLSLVRLPATPWTTAYQAPPSMGFSKQEYWSAQTTAQLHKSHMLTKECSKFSKLSFNRMWGKDFQMFKLVLEKAGEQAGEPEIKLPTSIGSYKKQENSRKSSIFVSLTTLKPLTLWITTNCGKILKDGNTRPPYLPPEKSVWRSRSKG